MVSNVGGKPLRSASAIVAGTESGQHLLKIDGYSRTKDVPTGTDFKSRTFFVGGHGWHLRYYPNGLNSECADHVSIFLQLSHDVAQGVKASYTFSLLDSAGRPSYVYSSNGPNIFRHTGWGFRTYIKRDELEKSEYLRDDSFTIRCDFTVFKELRTEDVAVDDVNPPLPISVVVPSSDLHRHLGALLGTGEGADVTFEVDGKTFAAHRCVLAARSPVFHAELFGPDKKSTTDGRGVVTIHIDNMEAQDFEALLYFMYTDSLSEMKGAGEAMAMLPDLVAAANRYKMKRLRLVCEEKLCECVNVKTVATILGFAEEYNCHRLKEKCLQFLNNTANLKAAMETDGLEHMSKSCPSVLKELIAKLAGSS